MTMTIFDYHNVMARGQTGLEDLRSTITPPAYACFKAATCALGIAIACATEAFSMTVALHAQFPVLSDGTDLGSEMLSMRWGIVAALILGHVVLHDSADQGSRPFRHLLHKWRALPILALIGGMTVFMFIATSQATGATDNYWSGWALGAACAALFSISFMAANKLTGHFLSALRVLLAIRAQKARVVDIADIMSAADVCHASAATLRREIEARELPGALHRKVAEEATGIVGMVAADAHDLHESCAAVPDDLRDIDMVDLPDTPLATLDRRQNYLKSLNVPFFLNLLKHKEA